MNSATRTSPVHATATQSQPVIFFAVISVILMLVGTNFFPIVMGSGRPASLTALVMLLPLALIMALRPMRTLKSIFVAPAIFLLLALAVASVKWSYLPANTLERSVPLVVTTLFAMSLGLMLPLRRLLMLLGCVGGLAMVASILAVITIPGARGVPPWEGTWNGIFNHKNSLGAASGFAALLLFGSMWMSQGRPRHWFMGLGMLALVMLAASQSRTSQIIFVLSMIAFYIARKSEKTALIWAASYLVLTVAIVGITYIAVASGIMDPVFAALERKPTLSGRIPLWTLVVPEMLKEFWFGYGYLGFWDETSNRVIVISTHPTLNFVPYYSHNGLIETWLNTGLVGLSLFVAATAQAFRHCFVLLRHAHDRRPAIVAVIMLIAFMLSNITESYILARAEFIWIAFVAICVGVSRAAQQAAATDRRAESIWQDRFTPQFQQTEKIR